MRSRLYEARSAKRNPPTWKIVRTLCQIYMAQSQNPKDKDLATKVVDEALVASPKDPALQIVRALIDDDKEKVKDLTLGAIAGISKVFDREMSYYDYYTSHGEKEEAAKHLNAAEAADPENTRIMDIRFTEGLVDRDWKKADKYVDRLGLKNMDEAHGLIYKYRLALAQSNYKQAESIALELVKSLPQFAQSWLCYGEVLKEQRQFEDAAAKFEMALQKQPENLEAYRGLIECNYELKKPEEAKRYIESAKKILGNSNPWLNEQAIAWELNYGDPAKALEPRRLAAEQNPEGMGAQLAYGAALWQVAQNFASKEKRDEANQSVKLARDVLTKVVAKWPDDRYAYAYLADMAIFNSDFAGGEKALKDLVARPSMAEIPDGYVMLGDFYARFSAIADQTESAKRVAAADAAYGVAISKLKSRTDPAGTDLARRVAAFYAMQHKSDRALEVLEPVDADRRVQQQIIEILMSDNKLTEASHVLDKRLAANPNDAQFLATKGFIQMMEKNSKAALVTLDRSLSARAAQSDCTLLPRHDSSAQRTDRVAGCDQDLTSARDVADDPHVQASISSQIQTRVALCEAYRANGQTEEAIHELQHVRTGAAV